jgi:hypothetical protein
MKFIKLTRLIGADQNEIDWWINFENVTSFGHKKSESKTRIGTETCEYFVRQTPEQILKMINGKKIESSPELRGRGEQ